MDRSTVLKKTAKILSSSSLEVITQGFAPKVGYDPKTRKAVRMYLPEVPKDASQELVTAINGAMVHEVGHVLYSDGDDISDETKPKLWHFIHNLIDDPYVNRCMARDFVGLRGDLIGIYKFLLNNPVPGKEQCIYSKDYIDKLPASTQEEIARIQLSYAWLWFAEKSKCQFVAGEYDRLDMDRFFATLEEKMDKSKVEALANINSSHDVAQLTDYFHDFFKQEVGNDSSGGEDEDNEQGEQGEGNGKPISAKQFEDLVDEMKSSDDMMGEMISEKLSSMSKASGKLIHMTDAYDKVIAAKDIARGIKDCSKIEAEVSGVTNYLTKDVRRFVESRDRRFYTGGYVSGRLNQGALASVKTGNNRIFSRKAEIVGTKSAVSLLIDCSGSMGGARIEMAASSAYALGLVLETLKVPFEIWGFTSTRTIAKTALYHEHVKLGLGGQVLDTSTYDVHYCFKSFDERFGPINKSALQELQRQNVTLDENEDSAAVKKALERLCIRSEDRKSLIVLSDGSPAYPCENGSGLSAKNLRDIVAAAPENYGVEVYGVGIQTRSVQHFYPKNAVVNHLSDLPNAIFTFLKTRI